MCAGSGGPPWDRRGFHPRGIFMGETHKYKWRGQRRTGMASMASIWHPLSISNRTDFFIFFFLWLVEHRPILPWWVRHPWTHRKNNNSFPYGWLCTRWILHMLSAVLCSLFFYKKTHSGILEELNKRKNICFLVPNCHHTEKQSGCTILHTWFGLFHVWGKRDVIHVFEFNSVVLILELPFLWTESKNIRDSCFGKEKGYKLCHSTLQVFASHFCHTQDHFSLGDPPP